MHDERNPTGDDPRPIGPTLDKVARLASEHAHQPVDGGQAEQQPTTWAELHQRNLADRWSQMVPDRYCSPTIDGKELGAEIATQLRGWSQAPDRNLVILGPVGTGKTYAAWAALRTPHFAGLSIAGTGVIDLLDALRPSGEDINQSALRTVDLLLLDDLGAERPSEWAAERILALLHHRWEQKRPVVVTANLTPAGLNQALGARAYSRLVGGALVLELRGRDRRRQP